MLMEKELDDTPNSNKDRKKHLWAWRLSIIGVVVGAVCFSVAIMINKVISEVSVGSGGMDIIGLFMLAGLGFSAIGLALEIYVLIVNLKDKTNYSTIAFSVKHDQMTRIILSFVGIGLASTFLVSLPLVMGNVDKRVNEYDKEVRSYPERIAAKERTFQIEPTLIKESDRYYNCFQYSKGDEYRSGRDILCSYLRYLYSNNWQEPTDARQLAESGFLPEYLQTRSDYEEEMTNQRLFITNEADLINRDFVREHGFLLTAHLSCNKTEDNSIVSVWYLTTKEQVGSIEEDDFVCLYYDYGVETDVRNLDIRPQAEKEKEEKLKQMGLVDEKNSEEVEVESAEGVETDEYSINIYTSEYKEEFEKAMKRLFIARNDNRFKYMLPYEDKVYNNEEFLQGFISSLPEELVSGWQE